MHVLLGGNHKSGWGQMEDQAFFPNSLRSLLYYTSDLSKFKCQNPVVSQSLKIWSQFKRYFKLNHCSVLTPLIKKQGYILLSDKTFMQWYLRGIHSIADLFINKTSATFEQLKQKFNIDYKDFFKHLQIRDLTRVALPSFPSQPQECIADRIMPRDPLKKGTISKMYQDLSQIDCMITLDHLKEAWSTDLAINITEDQWWEAQIRVHSSSVCSRHGLIQFKILHRLHLSKQRLARMFPGVDPSCERCGRDPASLSHTFWECPNITLYWTRIFETLTVILKTPIPMDPITALFGVPPANVNLNSKQKNILSYVTLLARRLILLNWKNKNPPTHQNLLRDIIQHLGLEKIKFSLRNKQELFYAIWQPFIDYFNNK
ncbi:hypothetical protein NQD34_018412 [Periophthalmus magnuspinnatus]|nr:hypothetical protein NQD34_018412 [Periophthalmus magnuspinnatus]